MKKNESMRELGEAVDRGMKATCDQIIEFGKQAAAFGLPNIQFREGAMTKQDILRYEVAASWWACWIGWGWGQSLAGRYFAWKVNRKWARYQREIEMAKLLNRKYGYDFPLGKVGP